MRAFFVIFLIVLFNLNTQGQVSDGSLNNTSDTFVLNDSIEVSVGDTILIDIPASADFLFVSRKKKKLGLSKLSQIGDIGSAVGGTLGTIGAATGSIGTLKTGIEIMNAGSVARSVGMTSEAIERLDVSKKAKKIIGTKAVVQELQPTGDENESFVKAIVANSEKMKELYEVSIAPAIYTGEIYILNN